jgi:hypothetical protein
VNSNPQEAPRGEARGQAQATANTDNRRGRAVDSARAAMLRHGEKPKESRTIIMTTMMIMLNRVATG